MTRREFAASIAAAGWLQTPRSQAAVFPVRYARPNPYDAALQFLLPGSDEFAGEKAAAELEARIGRFFAGKEAAPTALRPWVARRDLIRAARFYALPDDQVRFEIKMADAAGLQYHTGVWKLPDFHTVVSNAVTSPRPYFRDVTGHVFGNTPSFQQQLLKGNPYWRARMDSAAGIDVFGNQGIAVGDIDHDGLDEIYVCQPGGLPNRLYKLRQNGTAEDITERAGLSILDDTTCALFADFRNSGHQDLVVLRAQGPLFFVNQGDGRFREQPDAFRFESAAQGSFTGMAAADYDRDGRLDLYLCCYVYFQSEDQYQFPAPYYDARNGPPNFLFRNTPTQDGMIFEDVTQKTGMMENNNRFSFAPAWCDVNGGGWPDLYVANDFGRNNFYRNHEGTFHDEAVKSGVEDIGPGMGASWFDYDGDGRPDLYVSNMWTAAGQRVVRDPAFKPGAAEPEAFRRHTKGNSLYANRGGGTFEEQPGAGVEMGRWAWGSGGFDLDLDGVPEILIATGMTTNGDPGKDAESFFWRQVVAKSPSAQKSAPEYENGWSAINQAIRDETSWSGHQPNVFYVRRGGAFEDASGVSGFDYADDSRAFAISDFDGDGYPDILLKSRLGPQIRALQNDFASGRAAVTVVLQGTQSNRDAIGARVEVNGYTQFLAAGSGFLSQHSKKLHFGLQGHPTANLQIVWPSGARQEWKDLKPGYTYTLTEGQPEVRQVPFAARRLYANAAVASSNEPAFGNTWLLEPVPLPEARKGPGFLLIHAGESVTLPDSVPVERVDLRRESDEISAGYSLFRRYLFEYRVNLSLPLLLLIDDRSCARKVYSALSSADDLAGDLKKIAEGARDALPFPGRYYSPPRRNYFKLGAAFYWAGYPRLALPYLNETVRTQPSNWKAMLSIARLHDELGQNQEAKAAYDRVLQKRGDYVPALVGAGEAYKTSNDLTAAERLFRRALDVDPACADAMNQMGLLAAVSNRLDDAKAWFERAIAAQRDHSGAINNLGVLFTKLGKKNDAVAALLYGIEAAPDDETLYLNLCRIYVTMNERDQAREVLNRLLRRKPGNMTAIRALAEMESR